MAGWIRWIRDFGPLVSRIAAALFGGYALAALASVAVLALPMAKPQAVLTGMLASFAIYAGAVIWVFAVRSALRAWAGLLIVAAPLLAAAWSVW
ncbi:iron uptake protein [Azospirillum thiophilum]|uniref:Iron uptake protein n=2 Tax=Azospirillum thiophilum TaxID=528244 RepID=A0AAC8W0X8_9PROT|nr:iron uptake protein [Azospirillum thiophilum]KJR64686.1 iron uptake protein [Azospirillum thiophilum]